MTSTPPIAIALHGGSGVLPRTFFTPARETLYREALEACLLLGWQALEAGGTCIDAVELTVRGLEDSPLFNAGKGSVLNEDAGIECDAAIMDGAGQAGAIAGGNSIKNPISLARKLMEEPDVDFIAGEGVELLADRFEDIERVDKSYFVIPQRIEELEEAKAQRKMALDRVKLGTVGAVALDENGSLAAATSTGGLTNKVIGRVGDTPIIGAGTYASNATCAVSCTGVGELFIREVVGHEISARMKWGGQSLEHAARDVVFNSLAPIGGIGGLVAVDKAGNLAVEFNSESMYRAWKTRDQDTQVRIFRD
ncbi:MAG: isoaspartyl peptidase/L-asparaginase [Pseudomonadota bacterium]